MSQHLQPGDLVDQRRAAEILGVNQHTLENWRWRGVGPRARKIGQRLIRYHVADLARFIEGDDRADAA